MTLSARLILFSIFVLSITARGYSMKITGPHPGKIESNLIVLQFTKGDDYSLLAREKKTQYFTQFCITQKTDHLMRADEVHRVMEQHDCIRFYSISYLEGQSDLFIDFKGEKQNELKRLVIQRTYPSTDLSSTFLVRCAQYMTLAKNYDRLENEEDRIRLVNSLKSHSGLNAEYIGQTVLTGLLTRNSYLDAMLEDAPYLAFSGFLESFLEETEGLYFH